MENVFIKIAEDDKNIQGKKETIYRMDTVQKNLLETFLTGRNNALMFSKGNVDENGKATIVDPDSNRPIYISDGLIPQVEAFASKYAYNKFTIAVLRTAIMALNEKARKPTGNKYLFICNEPLWYQVGQVLETYLAQYHTDGTFMWSMKANDYVSVGAKGFDTYNWQGNQVSFIVDRALTYEYPGKGYGIALDLTGDKTNAQPPIACFTLKGGDMMTSYLKGVKKFTCAA